MVLLKLPIAELNQGVIKNCVKISLKFIQDFGRYHGHT